MTLVDEEVYEPADEGSVAVRYWGGDFQTLEIRWGAVAHYRNFIPPQRLTRGRENSPKLRPRKLFGVLIKHLTSAFVISATIDYGRCG